MFFTCISTLVLKNSDAYTYSLIEMVPNVNTQNELWEQKKVEFYTALYIESILMLSSCMYNLMQSHADCLSIGAI